MLRRPTLATENDRESAIHTIAVYMPGKPLLLVVVFGSLLALLGIILSLTWSGMWVQLVAGGLLLALGILVFSYFVWLQRTPVFLANMEGIRTRYLALHVKITWEEIAAFSAPGGGLLIKKRADTSQPQEVFVLEGSLSVSAQQLLIHLQEHFHTQLVQYNIFVQD